MPSFAKHFKKDYLSDCDFIVRVHPQEAASEAVTDEPAPKRARTAACDQHLQLAAFPAHKLVLCASEYFNAQVDSWQTNANSIESSSQHDEVKPSRPAIHLSVSSADELPAVEAVIASMYGVQDAFDNLQPDQLIQAIIIADMIDVTEAAEQASKCLKAAAASEKGLTVPAFNILADLPAWPECLQQLLPCILEHITRHCSTRSTATDSTNPEASTATDSTNAVQRMLLALFGNLQKVWQDDKLSNMLMQLPLPAMQLLLSSDKLRVPTEDLVLSTAQQYTYRQHERSAKTTARIELADLIRPPHLSDVMLHCIAVSTDSHKSLMKNYLTQLRRLLLLRRSMDNMSDEGIKEQLAKIPGIPCSWQLPQRAETPVVPAIAVWKAPLDVLKKACMDAYTNDVLTVRSVETPPLFGFPWSLAVFCEKVEDGVQIYVAVGSQGLSPGFYITCHYVVESIFRPPVRSVVCLETSECEYLRDYFSVGVMPGGWDDSVWAAKGLSMTDHLELELKVLNVL